MPEFHCLYCGANLRHSDHRLRPRRRIPTQEELIVVKGDSDVDDIYLDLLAWQRKLAHSALERFNRAISRTDFPSQGETHTLEQNFLEKLLVILPTRNIEEEPTYAPGHGIFAQFGVIGSRTEPYTTVTTVRPGAVLVNATRLYRWMLELAALSQKSAPIVAGTATVAVAEIVAAVTQRRPIAKEDANMLSAIIAAHPDDDVSTIQVAASRYGFTLDDVRHKHPLITDCIGRLKRLSRAGLLLQVEKPMKDIPVLSGVEMLARATADFSPLNQPVDPEFGIWALKEKWVVLR